MNWNIKRILFHMYATMGNGIDRHNIQQMSMASVKTVEESYQVIKGLLEDGYLVRENSIFKLTEKSQKIIKPLYEEIKAIMTSVQFVMKENIGDVVEVKGGTTGVYFTYGEKLRMFRFHPEEHNGELFVRMRLPNLLEELIEQKSNEIYVRKEVVNKGSFLIEVVKAHLQMLNDFDYPV